MDSKINKIKTDFIPLSITSIKEIIKKYLSENNKYNTEINNIIKTIEKLDNLLQKHLIPKYCLLKLNKYLIFINKNKHVIEKEYTDNEKIIIRDKCIFIISICFIRININKGNHFKIKNYLKSLLIFYIKGNISINNLFFILEIILLSIIESLKKNNIQQYQIFDINNKQLLFIKDIIETIINFPILLVNNNIFIESLINLFNKFFEYIDKSNIFLKEDELWLKLLENNILLNQIIALQLNYQTLY